MTYEILKNYIAVEYVLAEQYGRETKHLSALFAVVELHKPKHEITPNEIYCDCGIGYLQAYPCPTIEAIEKELK